MKEQYPAVAAIDIGTFTISVVIARWMQAEQKFDVVGLATKPNLGMQRGGLSDFPKLTESIASAVAEAEDMANFDIHSAYVAIPSVGLVSDNVFGTAYIDGNQVTAIDISKAFEIAKTKKSAPNLYLVNSYPLGVYLDDNDSLVTDPKGMRANKITSNHHIMQMPVTIMQNLEKAVVKAGKEVEKTTLSIVANGEAALSEQEKRMGVCLIDIGGSSIDVCVYMEGKVVLSFSESCGGYNVSNDIAIKFNVDIEQAEKIKCKYASVDLAGVDDNQTFVCHDIYTQEPIARKRAELVQVTIACYEDMLNIVYQKLTTAHVLSSNRRLVITGGGTQVDGIESFIKRFMGVAHVHKYAHPAQVTAQPALLSELQHMNYSTASGLLLYSRKFANSETSVAEGFLSPDSSSLIYRFIIAPWLRFKAMLQKVV